MTCGRSGDRDLGIGFQGVIVISALPKRHLLALLSCASVSALLSSSSLADSELIGNGDLFGGINDSGAFDVSSDGSTLVGQSASSNGWEAFRWTAAGGLQGLGDLPGGTFSSVAIAVSSDGSVVAGSSSSANGWEAFRWTAAGGMQGLGDLPGGVVSSVAFGMSDDGSVVVGQSMTATSGEAFRWTEAGGMQGLGILAGGSLNSSAHGASADGSVIVGDGYGGGFAEAFRWTELGGMVGLGDLPGGSVSSRARGVSSDGAVVVGYSSSSNGTEAFRWTAAGGMQGLGDLPGGGFVSYANDVSDDGSVVVGQGTSTNSNQAWRWMSGSDQGSGMQTIADLLSGDGIDIGTWELLTAEGVSGDGTVIVGYGLNPAGEYEAWRAVVDVGFVSVADFAGSLASMGKVAAAAQDMAQMKLGQVMNVARHFNHRQEFGQTSGGSRVSIPWSTLRFASNNLDGLSLAEGERAGRLAIWEIGGGSRYNGDASEFDAVTGALGMSWAWNSSLSFGLGGHLGKNDFATGTVGTSSTRSTLGIDGFIAYEPADKPLRLYAGFDRTKVEDDLVRGYLNGIDLVTVENERDGSATGSAYVAGWVIPAGDNASIMPFAEYDRTRIKLDGYTETSGPFPATFDEIDHTNKIAKLGTELKIAVGRSVILWGSAAIVHQFDDKLPGISGSIARLPGNFSLAGAATGQNWGEGRVGLSGQINEHVSINASVNASFASDDEPFYGGSFGVNIRL